MSVQSNTLFNKKLILYIFSLYIHKKFITSNIYNEVTISP